METFRELYWFFFCRHGLELGLVVVVVAVGETAGKRGDTKFRPGKDGKGKGTDMWFEDVPG